MMLKYISPEIELIEFSVTDVLTNSAVVTTVPGGNISVGGNGGDGYIDYDDILWYKLFKSLKGENDQW